MEALKFNNSGVENYRRVNFDDAILDYTKAIELNPELGVAYYNRGTVLYRLGLHESAFSDLSKALQIDPNNSEFSEAVKDCQTMMPHEQPNSATKKSDEGPNA